MSSTSSHPVPSSFHSVLTPDGWRLQIQAFLPEKIRDPRPWICIHGFSQSHLTWTAGGFAQHLASFGCPVYVIDFRGHGGSTLDLQPASLPEACAKDWTLDDYFLQDLPAVMDFVKERHLGEDIVLCGHSMGGVMAVATAIRLRERGIAAVVTIAAPFSPEHMGKRLKVPARILHKMYPWIKKAKISWRRLPMEHFFSLMNQVYYARKPKLGRLLPYTTPRDKIQIVPRLWHPAHIDEDTVSHILRNSHPEPMGVVFEWSHWAQTGSVYFGYPAAVDYSRLYHRLSVPVIAAWGEDDFLAPPLTGEMFRQSVRSRRQIFLSLPRTHHIDITAGTPAHSILQEILGMLEEGF